MDSRYQADKHFRGLGATHYYDSMYPGSYRSYDGVGQPTWHKSLFSRHYFNPEGTEIGLCIPDLMPEGGIQVFDTPRVWGIPHDLIPLDGPSRPAVRELV